MPSLKAFCRQKVAVPAAVMKTPTATCRNSLPAHPLASLDSVTVKGLIDHHVFTDGLQRGLCQGKVGVSFGGGDND